VWHVHESHGNEGNGTDFTNFFMRRSSPEDMAPVTAPPQKKPSNPEQPRDTSFLTEPPLKHVRCDRGVLSAT